MHSLEIASAIANIVMALVALIGIPLILHQVQLQVRDARARSIIDIYDDLDTEKSRKARRFVYNEMPETFEKGNLNSDAEDQIRSVLAALDRIGYRVLRGFADKQAAYDLYGGALIKTMFNVWPWLVQDRAHRGVLYQFRYCRFAEQLALEFAERRLKAVGKWKREYARLLPEQLLATALTEAMEHPNIDDNRTKNRHGASATNE
jgi:hypothetical protein